MILDRNTIPPRTNCDNATLRLAFDELKSLWQKRFGIPTEIPTRHLVNIRFEVNAVFEGFTVTADATFQASTPTEILYVVYDFAEEFLNFCFFKHGNDRVERQYN